MFGIRTFFVKRKYRKLNKHNYTKIKNCIDISKIQVGIGSYGVIDTKTYGGKNCNLKIGNYCSIAGETVFLLGGEHSYNRLSTYPFKAKYLNVGESENKGDIILEDDVWIGQGCTILSGVTIGRGAIIGAKSVVAKNIPPYAIYCGNRIVKYRFSNEIIEKLKQIDFSQITKEFIEQNIELLYQEITEYNVDEIINKIKEKNK